MYEEQKLILQKIDETFPIYDSQISNHLDIDLYKIRFYLDKMEKLDLIKQRKDSIFGIDGEKYQVLKLTPKGYMVSRGEISIESIETDENNFTSAINNNFVRNIEIKEGNYNEHVKGNNIQGDSNVNHSLNYQIDNQKTTLKNKKYKKLFLVGNVIVIGSTSIIFGLSNLMNLFNNSLLPEKPAIANSCSNTNVNSNNINETSLISSATGVDYTKLRDILANCQATVKDETRFKKAEDETRLKMLEAAGQNLYEALTKEKFPCDDLEIVDQMWKENSNGKFGFSVQVKIFEELGGDWNKFGDEVGWRKEGKWLYGDDLIYNLDKAPSGHLPRSLGPNMGGNKGRKALFDKVKACNLSSS